MRLRRRLSVFVVAFEFRLVSGVSRPEFCLCVSVARGVFLPGNDFRAGFGKLFHRCIIERFAGNLCGKNGGAVIVDFAGVGVRGNVYYFVRQRADFESVFAG